MQSHRQKLILQEHTFHDFATFRLGCSAAVLVRFAGPTACPRTRFCWSQCVRLFAEVLSKSCWSTAWIRLVAEPTTTSNTTKRLFSSLANKRFGSTGKLHQLQQTKVGKRVQQVKFSHDSVVVDTKSCQTEHNSFSPFVLRCSLLN